MSLEPTKKLRDILERVVSLDEDAAFFFVFSIKDNQAKIIELNTMGQLFNEGVDSLNRLLGDYAPSTRESKIRRFGASFPSHITLFEEGDFYDSFKVKVFNNGKFEITANTQKNDTDLAQRYGEEIIGLTEESTEILSEFVVKDLVQYVRVELGLQ